MSSHPNREEELNQLFADFRRDLPDYDGGADFVPGLWAKIEKRKAQGSVWFAWTRLILAGACCVGALFVGFSVWSPLEQSAYYEESYVETLEASDDLIVLAALHPASPIVKPTE